MDRMDKEVFGRGKSHLKYIRAAFKSGDFNIPGFVHDQTPRCTDYEEAEGPDSVQV